MQIRKLRFIFRIFIIATASLVLTGFENNTVFAEEANGFAMAEDISAHLTFKFKDGIEKHEFAVFKSTDFVNGKWVSDPANFMDAGEDIMFQSFDGNYLEPSLGTSFQVQGVVSDLPHLHKALDEAYKFRATNTVDYNYKLFDIDVEFTHASGKYDMKNLGYHAKGGADYLLPENVKPRKTLHYTDCEVSDYLVGTQHNGYRSYNIHAETGFAIVETIKFQCGGIRSEVTNQEGPPYTSPGKINDFGKLDYNYAEDIRTFVTFEFDNGIERIEFPIFYLISGFAEDDDPSFHVEGVVNRYPLLASAIDKARDVRALSLGSNLDFNAKVEFVKETPEGETLLRGINFEDCNVVGSDMATYYDHEEPFANAGGFAVNHSMDFDCAGMNPQNPRYDENMTTNEQYRDYLMASGINAIAEFRFEDNTSTTIDFPIFKQNEILSKSNPTFQLTGMIGEYPLLYKQIDEMAKINQISGTTLTQELFDVEVNLKDDKQKVRGFSYSDCRLTDYLVTTQKGNEEGFFFWFALDNTFEFECLGYEPKNPLYDAMFESPKAKSLSTFDLRETQTWGPLFKHDSNR